MSNESFPFASIDSTERFLNLLKSTGAPISTLLLKHDASKCSEHNASILLAGQSVNPGEGHPFLFSFCFLQELKVCIEMPGVLELFMQLTLFCCLQHSTVSQLSSSVFRFSLPFHFTCLTVKSKEQNSAFVMCNQLSSRVRCKLGSITYLFSA